VSDLEVDQNIMLAQRHPHAAREEEIVVEALHSRGYLVCLFAAGTTGERAPMGLCARQRACGRFWASRF